MPRVELVQEGDQSLNTKLSWYEKAGHSVRYWLLRHLPTCKQTVEVISESLDRPLSFRERVLLKLHLWVCIWCVWYVEHLQLMRTTLRTPSGEGQPTDHLSMATLSDESRERMKRKLTSNN